MVILWFKTFSAVGENWDPSLFSRKLTKLGSESIKHGLLALTIFGDVQPSSAVKI